MMVSTLPHVGLVVLGLLSTATSAGEILTTPETRSTTEAAGRNVLGKRIGQHNPGTATTWECEYCMFQKPAVTNFDADYAWCDLQGECAGDMKREIEIDFRSTGGYPSRGYIMQATKSWLRCLECVDKYSYTAGTTAAHGFDGCEKLGSCSRMNRVDYDVRFDSLFAPHAYVNEVKAIDKKLEA